MAAEAAGPHMQDFVLKERKHVAGRSGSLGAGLVPVQQEPLVPGGHLSRQHTLHQHAASESTAAPGPAGATSSSATGAGHWVTSYQAQTAGEHFQQRRPTGKRMVPGATGASTSAGSSVGGLFSTFGQARVSDLERDRSLQLGTTKASQHIPGFTGHIPHNDAQRAQQVAARDVDKSKPLITVNYNPIPGCTKRIK